MKRLLALLLCTSHIISAESLFSKIAQENLKSFPAVPKKPDPEFKKFRDHAKDQLRQQLQPDDEKKRRLVFSILEENCKEQASSCFDQRTWQDLELLSGPKSNPALSIAANVDHTHTEFGKAMLFKKLVQLESDPAKLIQQQATVRLLVEDQSLFSALETSLKKLATPENIMLSFWEEDFFNFFIQRKKVIWLPDALAETKFYKKIDPVNKNEIALEINQKADIVSRMVAMGILSVSTVSLASYAGAKLFDLPIADSLDNLNQKLGVRGALSLFSLSGILLYFMDSVRHDRILGAAGAGVSSTYGGFLDMIMFDNLRDDLFINNCFQEKMTHVAAYVAELNHMNDLIKQHPEATMLECLQQFQEKVTRLRHHSANMQKLLTMINTQTFKGKPSFFSRTGRIIAAYKLMLELKNEFVDCMIAMGELDAQMSIAQLYKEHEHKAAHYCFPEYLSEQTPGISIKGFWNPIIDCAKAVGNDLAIGLSFGEKQNCIITGPNAGGKSTTMKGLIIGVILAQTFGIAPAQELSFTPFKSIITYLNITDDIAAGNSHFKAGVLRARDILQTTECLKPGELCLTAVDEVFNGTSPREGEAAAFSFVKQLGTKQNNICITATHFPSVTKLAHDGNFTNYKVVVDQTSGKLKYPYKLERGVSDQIITFQILQEEGFSDSFLLDAERALQRPL